MSLSDKLFIFKVNVEYGNRGLFWSSREFEQSIVSANQELAETYLRIHYGDHQRDWRDLKISLLYTKSIDAIISIR